VSGGEGACKHGDTVLVAFGNLKRCKDCGQVEGIDKKWRTP
jgi:hypothetical protein